MGGEDYWSFVKRRIMTEDEIRLGAQVDEALGPDWSSPFNSAVMFVYALGDPAANRKALRRLVVRRTRASWGNFSSASRALRAIDRWGIGSVPDVADGFADVSYVPLLAHVKRSFQVVDETEVVSAATITLVLDHRESFWHVFSLGRAVEPEIVLNES
jgi:hypothetical protein